MDLSTLKIAIDTTDFARAKKEIGDFTKFAGDAEKKVTNQTKTATAEAAAIHKQAGIILLQDWKQRGALESAIHKQTGGILLQQWKQRGADEKAIHKQTGDELLMQYKQFGAQEAAIHKQNGAILLSQWKERGAAAKAAASNSALEAKALNDLRSSLDPVYASTQRLNQSKATLSAALKSGSISITEYNSLLAKAGRSTSIMDKYSHQLKRTLLDLTPIISGVGLLTLAHGAIQATDKYTKLTSQLKIATNSAIEYGHALSEVKRISSAAQADITAITSLYQRLSLATEASGVSQKEIAMITETVALGLKANGASARESASAMLQLSQSFGSGRMAGEEFNSMAEAAPNVLRALAKSMGVPYGQLKQLASETKITTDVMVKAFTDPALLETFRAQAASMRTITGSWVELTNALVLYVGENAKASGGVGVISGTLSLLADNLKIVADTLVIAASILLTRFILGLTVSTANSILLTAANIRLSASFVAITASATASAAAMGVATLAARTLQAAMGPIGWVSLAVGAGVTAWMAWGDEGEKAVNKVDGVIKKANNSFAETDHNLLFISKSWAELQAQFTKGDISQAQFAAGITKMYDELLPKATKAQKELSKSQEELNKQLGEGRKYYEDYWTGIETSTEKLIEQAKQMEWDNSLIGLSKDAIAAATKERENEAIMKAQSNLETMKSIKDTLPKEIQLQEELISALKRKQAAIEGKATGEAAKAAIDAQNKAADDAIKAQTKAHEEMWKKVDGFAHDAFDNIFDKGKNAFEEIGKVIKKSILDMLYRMTVQKWIFSIGTTSAGVGAAGMAGAAGIGGADGGSSWLSAGKSIYDGFSGAFTYSSTATTGLSGMFNSFATSSMGQSLGLSTAGELSLATGEFAQSVSSFGSTVGTFGSYAGAGLAGIGLGTMIAGDKVVLGMDGKTTSMIGAAIGTAILPGLGTFVGGVAGGLFSAAFGRGPKVSGTTTLAGQFGGEGFAGQYQTPWSQKGGWFSSGRSGVDVQGVGAEQQAALNNVVIGTKSVFDNLIAASGDANKSIAGWTFAINRQIATQEQQNQLIIDMADSMGNYLIPSLEAFKAEGENLADTAVRMRDEFILTDSILRLVGGSFGAVGLASMGARDNLVQLMGGIQSMNTTMQSYYQNFFTDAERHANDLGALTIQFASLGLAVPQTASDFKLLVSSQNLSTESGRQLFAALMSLNGAFAALVPTAEAAAQAIEANIKSLQDKAIADYNAARQATDSLRAFALSVRELQQALWAGSQTPLSSTYDVTRSQFAATNVLAGAGDTNAQGNLAGSATAFLDAARLQATSAIEYARDFAFVQNALSETASKTEVVVTVADAQLTVMELIHQAIIEGNDKSYAALLSVQSEINLAKLAGTLDVDTLRGVVTATTDKQISAVDTMNQSVLRITDPSGALIGASNAIQTEVVNNAGYTSKITDTLNTATNPILDSMGVWLNSINTQSSVQTQSLQYLLAASITASDAARMAVVEQSITKLSADIAAAVGSGYSASNLMRSTGAAGETALSYAGVYKTVDGTISATGAASALSETVSAAQQAALVEKQAADQIAAQSLLSAQATPIYSASNPDPTKVAARNSAIAAADAAYSSVVDADWGRGSSARMQRALSAAQAEIDTAKALPTFAIGTNEVPFDMTARIHAGEEIKPRQFVEKDKSDKKETNELLRKLIAANDDMKKELVAIKSTNYKMWQIDDKHDIEGMPAVRTA